MNTDHVEHTLDNPTPTPMKVVVTFNIRDDFGGGSKRRRALLPKWIAQGIAAHFWNKPYLAGATMSVDDGPPVEVHGL